MTSLVWIYVLLLLLLNQTFRVRNEDENVRMRNQIDESMKRFASHLFMEVIQGKYNNSNVFISPWSVHSALSLTLAATGGRTHTQIAMGMGLPSSLSNDITKDKLHKYLGEWQRAQISNTDGINFTLANRAFVEKSFPLKKGFQDLLKTNYEATVGQENFTGAAAEARKHINEWVETVTQGKIHDLLSEEQISALTRLVLVNAVNFKGQWKVKFNKSDTTEEDFHCIHATEPKKVAMMHLKTKMEFASIRDWQVKAVWLPFSDNRTSLVVVLPDAQDGLPALLAKVKKSPESLFKMLRTSARRHVVVDVRLPRLKLEFQISLNNILKKGKAFKMEYMFDPSKADFSPMTERSQGLYVSNVMHKAAFEVDEDGATAAAATSVESKWRSAAPRAETFHVDRPFLFYLLSKEEAPLFMGRVVCV